MRMTRICAWRRRWSILPAVLGRAALFTGLVAVVWLLGHATAMATEQAPTARDVSPAEQRLDASTVGTPTTPSIAERVRESIARAQADEAAPPDEETEDGQAHQHPAASPGRHHTADAVAAELREHRERAQSAEIPADSAPSDSAESAEIDRAPADEQDSPPKRDDADAARRTAERTADHLPADDPTEQAEPRTTSPPVPADTDVSPDSGTAPHQHEHALPQPRAPDSAPLPLPQQPPASAVVTMTGSASGSGALRPMPLPHPRTTVFATSSRLSRSYSTEPALTGTTPDGPTASPD